MVATDLDEVCIIEQESFADPWSKASFIESISNPNNHYLVARADGLIAGYCGYWGVVGEGYIYNVAVKESFRRLGIGFMMLEKLIEQADGRGTTSLTLEVRQSNISAIHLYRKLGFTEAGIRKDFYTNPLEDAIIMWRTPIQ
jgi:ribosomal-protein-alanine N-acetyltransferase